MIYGVHFHARISDAQATALMKLAEPGRFPNGEYSAAVLWTEHPPLSAKETRSVPGLLRAGLVDGSLRPTRKGLICASA